MILNIYYGEQLLEKSGAVGFLDGMFTSVVFFIILIFGIFGIIFVYLFLIKPLVFKKNPEKIYNQYLLLRDEMEKIDTLYVKNQINFEDYVFAQFNNAKEYEQIIFLLSKFPQYKSKIKSYTIAYTKNQKEEETNSKEDIIFIKNVNWLYEILYPHTKYYTQDEIYQGILDQGYNQEIAQTVISKYLKDGVSFSSQIYYPEKKTAKFINKLFGYHTPTEENSSHTEKNINMKNDSEKTVSNISPDDKIDISLLNNKQKTFFDEDSEDIQKFKFVEEKEKERRKSLLSKIFNKKKGPATVDQINSIFKDIQKHIEK
jgi:hypothetical protein